MDFVEDAHARAALAAATGTVTGEFSRALAAGQGVGYVRQIVPAAFAPAVDDLLATRLFAALVAVVVRLGLARPAACVAEELMAVALIAEATAALEDEGLAGRLGPEEVERAHEALAGVFALFEDDDVLLLFEMHEPADAALSAHDPERRALGVVDQRIEAWFEPFGDEPRLGHLLA